MNALKHMELIFGVVVVAGCVAAAMPAGGFDQAQPASARPETAPPAMPVVVVKGKRMTALEKRAAVDADADRHNGATGA